MKLDTRYLAQKAMQEDVDMRRLYVELVESLVETLGPTLRLPGNLHVAPLAEGETRQRIRELGFEQLKNRRWKDVLGMGEKTNTKPLDDLEKFIETFGPNVNIHDAKELRLAIMTYAQLAPNANLEALLSCLAETALNQTLDKEGIGRIEMNMIQDSMDADLVEQNRQMVEMIRSKMLLLLQGA